jgi:hypothetical protein
MVRSGLARPRQGRIDRCCSFAVVVAEQVRVDTQCNVWLGVSQALADGEDIDASIDELRGVSGVSLRETSRLACRCHPRSRPRRPIERLAIAGCPRSSRTTASSGRRPAPSCIRSSSMALRCSRKASTKMSGKVTSRRPALVFAGLNRMPCALVCCSASRSDGTPSPLRLRPIYGLEPPRSLSLGRERA